MRGTVIVHLPPQRWARPQEFLWKNVRLHSYFIALFRTCIKAFCIVPQSISRTEIVWNRWTGEHIFTTDAVFSFTRSEHLCGSSIDTGGGPASTDSSTASNWAALTTGFPAPRSSASPVNQRAAILKLHPACLLYIHASAPVRRVISFSSLPIFPFPSFLNSPLFSGPTSIFIPPFPREESCRWRRLGDLLLVTMATLSKARVKQAHACCLSRTCLVFSLYSPSASAPFWFT